MAESKEKTGNKQKVIITQSMIKSFVDYLNEEECGLVFVEKYLKKNYDLFKPTDVQQVGNYFEYQCIGATTKSNDVPQPKYNKDGKTLTAKYKNVQPHIQNFKKFMKFYGIEIVGVQSKLSVGETAITTINKNTNEQEVYFVDGLEGTTDLICKAKIPITGLYETENNGKKSKSFQIIIEAGEEFILDIKTSGLLTDKYSPYGWDLEKLHEKEKLIRQPIHYKYLSQLIYGRQYKFVFLLFSQTNDYDYRALLFNIDEEEEIKRHEELIVWADKWIKYNLKTGFKAYPSVTRCHKCPLKKGCPEFQGVPDIKVYYYQPQVT